MALITEDCQCCICDVDDKKSIKRISLNGAILNLVRCRRCGLIFFSPRFSQEYISQLYRLDHFDQLKNNKGYFEEDIAEFNKRLSLVSNYSHGISSVLDIGCSTGNFLVACRNRNLQELHGVDLNEKTNEYCRNVLSLDVSDKVPDSQFDLVHASDLIEHLPNPNQFLEGIRKNLKDGGVLMMTTPNIKNPVNKVLNIKPEEHLYYFSRQTLRKILEKNGYKVIVIKRWNRYHSLKNLVDTTTASSMRPVLKFIISMHLDGIFDWLVLKNLYTDLMVIAKKS